MDLGQANIRGNKVPVWVARIISEDDEWMMLEVPKSVDSKFTLDKEKENNRFVTFIFTDGLPWEK